MDALGDAIVIGGEIMKQLPIVIVPLPHIYRCLHAPAERAVIDVGVETGDHSSIDQSLDSCSRSIRAKPDDTAELPLGETGVTSQFTEYFSVQFIDHSTYHCIRLS